MSGKSLRGPAPSLADACQPAPETAWVYLLRCPDGSLYGGWTIDLARRLKAHRTGKGGAKYTKSHGGPAVRLAYAERCADKSAALKREAAIKKLPKAEKEALAAKWAADNRITIRMATPADGRLQGFACAHPWYSREAYAWNVEATIYCAPDCIGQGLGKRLYTALLELLRMQGYYNAFAIVTGENKASHEFHKRMGFTKSFVEKHSGYKFGRWLDVVYWQYPLRTGEAPPEPVRYRLTEAEVVSILKKVNL